MKTLVNDTIWFKSPDGGEVKMSMGGYLPSEVDRLKEKMTAAGWEEVSHETTFKGASIPVWVIPTLIGFVIGAIWSWSLFQH